MIADISRRPVISAAVSAAGLVSLLVCIAYIDRPVAAFAHTHWSGTRLFGLAFAILRPSRAVLALVALFLVNCGAWSLAGRRLPDWARRLLPAALAAVVALVVALALKFAIGRSQADPLYVSSHIYEFRPFRGGNGYKAFPSATMAVASAMLAALCLESARRRFAAGAVLTLLAGCLVATNGHWIADILGGVYLGIVVGWGILRAYERAWCPTKTSELRLE